MENNGKRYVSWREFWTIIVIAIAIIGTTFGIALSSFNMSNDNRVSIGKIESTLTSIDKSLQRIEEAIKLFKN